jgi:hypothetical protein
MNFLTKAGDARHLGIIRRLVPNKVSVAVGRQILKTQKHSPTILFGVGVVGVVATAVMASKATLELDKIVDEAKTDLDWCKTNHESGEYPEYTDRAYSHDVAVIYARTGRKLIRLYAPTLGVGFLSIASLTGSHYILTQRNMALTAAYAALDKSYKNYRRRVAEEIGEENELEFRNGVTSEVVIKGDEAKTIKKVDPNAVSEYARFFDQLSPSWNKQPEYNMIFLRAQQNYFNDLLLSRGHIFLNEVYDALGIPRSRAGAVVGWILSKDGDNYVDMGIYSSDREMARRFVNGDEGAILLDFNVDGVIFDKI